MGKIWFTSDLHLGHKNILRLDNRPFGDIDAHDETIINNYNRVVAQDDIVYILGDILWNQSYESYKQLFNRLNGRKAIILGNHDNRQHLLRCCKEGLVLSVKESQIINIGKESVFLSHYPHREWNGFYRGFYHLYAHCHGNLEDYKQSTDVCTSLWEFEPVSWEEVKEYIDKNCEPNV